MNSSSLSHSQQTIGTLSCSIVDTPRLEDSLQTIVILCHGFGAPGNDLVPCAAEIYAQRPQQLHDVRFVFPAAPMQLDPSGLYDSRAWWPIDVNKLQQMILSGRFRDLRNQRPDLLEGRYEQMVELISAVQADAGLGNDRLILGGFSQGSMLATEVALRIDRPPAGLVVWSGALLSQSQWRQYCERRGRLSVVQTHGQLDPILPFVGGQWLHQLFVEYDFDASFYPFLGQHTIPREGISQAAELIAKGGC